MIDRYLKFEELSFGECENYVTKKFAAIDDTGTATTGRTEKKKMAEDFDIEALLEAPYNNVSTTSMNDVLKIHIHSQSTLYFDVETRTLTEK